jgi:hypothetical protein
MSMHRRRNVIVPLWFAIFALAAFFLPRGTYGWSLFLLVLGLTVPAMGKCRPAAARLAPHDVSGLRQAAGPRLSGCPRLFVSTL